MEVCFFIINTSEYYKLILEKFRLDRVDGLVHNAGVMDTKKDVKQSVTFFAFYYFFEIELV